MVADLGILTSDVERLVRGLGGDRVRVIVSLLVSQGEVLIHLGLGGGGPSERELGELDHLGINK